MANSAGLRQTALAQDTADRVCIMLLIIHRLLSSASVPRSCHITRTGLDIKSPNQIKSLASDARTYFVSAGSAGVSLPPRLCTWLPGLRSSARVTPQRTSTTALFDYISAGHSTHCAFYYWRPHLSSDCCIGLEQSAGVGPVVSVIASFPQQTENRTFCLVLQS